MQYHILKTYNKYYLTTKSKVDVKKWVTQLAEKMLL
jgi:hypothetical protein